VIHQAGLVSIFKIILDLANKSKQTNKNLSNPKWLSQTGNFICKLTGKGVEANI
jgi:hypothetical protein